MLLQINVKYVTDSRAYFKVEEATTKGGGRQGIRK